MGIDTLKTDFYELLDSPLAQAIGLASALIGIYSWFVAKKLRHQGDRINHLHADNDRLRGRDPRYLLSKLRTSQNYNEEKTARRNLMAGIHENESHLYKAYVVLAHDFIVASRGRHLRAIARAMRHARIALAIRRDFESLQLVAATEFLADEARSGDRSRRETAMIFTMLFATAPVGTDFGEIGVKLFCRALDNLDSGKERTKALQLAEGSLYAISHQHGADSEIANLARVVRDICALADGQITDTFAKSAEHLGLKTADVQEVIQRRAQLNEIDAETETGQELLNITKELNDILLEQMVLLARTKLAADASDRTEDGEKPS